jgi:acetyl esterase/lipase
MERSLDLLTRPAPPFDVRLHYGPASSQFGELRLPKAAGPFPVVVGLHGGWWRAAHGTETHAHLCAAITALGVATWNVEYRRLGEAGGGWPGTLQDVSAAVDFLAEIAATYDLDLSRVVAVGFSAGGQLALWAGSRRAPFGTSAVKLRAAVSLAGAVDLVRCAELGLSEGVVETFLGGPPGDVPERYRQSSPRELLPLGVAQTLIHGTHDTSVPAEISERYFAAARAKDDPCDLQLLPDVGHFELIDPLSAPWLIVRDAVMAAL